MEDWHAIANFLGVRVSMHKYSWFLILVLLKFKFTAEHGTLLNLLGGTSVVKFAMDNFSASDDFFVIVV